MARVRGLGESGKPVKSTRSNQLDVFAGYAVIPLKSKGESRDKSQGATVVRLIDQHKDKEGDEELVFETAAKHQTNVNYPSVHLPAIQKRGRDDAVLYKFSGPSIPKWHQGPVGCSLRLPDCCQNECECCDSTAYFFASKFGGSISFGQSGRETALIGASEV